jgi:hypothetical protein
MITLIRKTYLKTKTDNALINEQLAYTVVIGFENIIFSAFPIKRHFYFFLEGN